MAYRAGQAVLNVMYVDRSYLGPPGRDTLWLNVYYRQPNKEYSSKIGGIAWKSIVVQSVSVVWKVNAPKQVGNAIS